MRESIRAIALLAVLTGPVLRLSAAGPDHASELANSVRIERVDTAGADSVVEVNDTVWSAHRLTLRALLSEVYGIEPSRIQISGVARPDDQFDLTLPLRGYETHAVIRAALERALAAQFDLTLAFETRTIESYVFQAEPGSAAKITRRSGSGTTDVPGSITVAGEQCPGVFTGEITARHATISGLAEALDDSLDRPVLDETGLTGAYDFHIPEYRSTEELFGFLQSELGIHVTRQQRPVKVLTVRSTSNRAYELRSGV